MDDLAQAVDKFHFLYDRMRIAYDLLYRSKFSYGSCVVEIYQAQELTTEAKRIIKAEGETQTEAYEQATRDLIRWHNLQNTKEEFESERGKRYL